MRALLIMLALSISGCATPPQPPARVAPSACGWLQPMTASPADTAGTKREILEYEIARRANCAVQGGGP